MALVGAILGSIAFVGVLVNGQAASALSSDQDSICKVVNMTKIINFVCSNIRFK